MQIPARLGESWPLYRTPVDVILREYQVGPDPRGYVRALPYDGDLGGGNPEITRTEADMLDELGMLGKAQMIAQQQL